MFRTQKSPLDSWTVLRSSVARCRCRCPWSAHPVRWCIIESTHNPWMDKISSMNGCIRTGHFRIRRHKDTAETDRQSSMLFPSLLIHRVPSSPTAFLPFSFFCPFVVFVCPATLAPWSLHKATTATPSIPLGRHKCHGCSHLHLIPSTQQLPPTLPGSRSPSSPAAAPVA